MSAKDGECRLLQNIALNNTYEHTIYFANESAQEAFFKSKTKSGMVFHNLSHTQIYSGKIRLPTNPDGLYNCNYMMCRNANKWIYSFITAVNYINDATAEILFEIDCIQTWLFNFSFQQCFVERMHVLSDSRWAWLAPEPIQPVEMRYLSMKNVGNHSWRKHYLVYSGYSYDAISSPPKWVKASGYVVNQTYQASDLYLAKNEEELQKIINKLKNASDSPIYTIQVIPAFLGNTLTRVETSTNQYEVLKNPNYVTKVSGNLSFNHSKIGTYTPKNNKLFNYPYYGLYVTNQQGINEVYDFAFFDNKSTIPYTIYGDTTPNNSCVLKIGNYKSNGGHDFDIQLGQSPQAQYNNDSYKQYELNQAQIKVSGTLSAVSDAQQIASSATSGAIEGFAVGGAAGAVGGAIASAGGNIISGITNALNTMAQLDFSSQQYQMQPPAIHNLIGNSDLSYKANFEKPKYGIRAMKLDALKRLDNFLDVYGYQINAITKPNRSGRKAWNYVKTANCCVNGTLPAWANSVICRAHNSGITYWKNGNNIGNYNQDNTL